MARNTRLHSAIVLYHCDITLKLLMHIQDVVIHSALFPMTHYSNCGWQHVLQCPLCHAFPPPAPTTLPMTPCDTPCPLNGDASHTYETPLRPSVTISCDGDENSDAVIVNHTRSSSNAEASVYEEPLVSVQYDSIFGEQVCEILSY